MALQGREKLANARPVLRRFAEALADRFDGEFDVTIVEVDRSLTRSADLYAQGRTVLKDAKGNPLGVVTNARPGESPHNPDDDGAVWAFDAVPVVAGKQAWNDHAKFDAMGKFVKDFWSDEIEWGGGWTSIKDKPHFQEKGWKNPGPKWPGQQQTQVSSQTQARQSGALWPPLYTR